MIEANRSGPVAEAERIVALDVLRGVAVLGILLTNIQHFAMYAGTTRDPTLYGDLQGANLAVYALTFNLAYQKFLPIFSMLFGAGIVLAADRREAAGLGAAGQHYRRMTVLMAIGLVHAYLIWYGDILFAYAVCGSVVFLLRRRSPQFLIGLGIGILAVSPLIRIVFFIIPSMLGAGGAGAETTVEQAIAADLAAFRGAWLEQLRMRASYSFEVQTLGLVVVYFWRASGLMWIGMGLYKLGVLTGARSRGLYLTLMLIAFALALPVTAIGFLLCLVTRWQNFPIRFLADNVVIYFVGIAISLGYVAIVMLACRGGCRAWPGRALAAVGRMALTNYLMHSIVCTFIFYGHGLGLYGFVERTGQLGIVAGVWAVQLIVSPLWLRFFRFGPAEWLWRTLAYGRLQPVLSDPAVAPP